jgi:hypothetical protein
VTTRSRLEPAVWLVLAALLLPGVGSARTEATGKPLHITGRVLRANELSGFVPKERAVPVLSVVDWNEIAPSGGVDVEARLRRAGFIAAVREDLKWSSGSDRAALSAVVRLGSAEAARAEIARVVRDFAEEPKSGRVKRPRRSRWPESREHTASPRPPRRVPAITSSSPTALSRTTSAWDGVHRSRTYQHGHS